MLLNNFIITALIFDYKILINLKVSMKQKKKGDNMFWNTVADIRNLSFLSIIPKQIVT
jgi:hypothetical protein